MNSIFKNGIFEAENTTLYVFKSKEARDRFFGEYPTNFDKIKDMNIKEMARFLEYYINCSACPISKSCDKTTRHNCADKLQKWLESEVN